MTQFNFRLQFLLKLREAKRMERRAQLAEAFEAQRMLEQKAKSLDFELDSVREQMRRAGQVGKVDVDALLVSHRYQLVIQAHRQQLENQAKEIAAEIDHRRELLVEAEKQVRVLEKLRQRKLKAHNWKQRRGELKEMDEMAMRRIARTPE